MENIEMVFSIFRGGTEYDVMGRVVIVDGVARGVPPPHPDLRRLRGVEKEIVLYSGLIQKKLDLCYHLCKGVTGASGGYEHDRSGTEYLDCYSYESAIELLLAYKTRDLGKVMKRYAELEKECDEWTEKSRKKNEAHHAALAIRRLEEAKDKAFIKEFRAEFHYQKYNKY
jgi:hypothetical protein